MLDWEPFEAAVRRGNHRAALLASIRRVERWLDPSPAVGSDYRDAIATADGARAIYRALLLVQWRLLRELGLAFDPAGMGALAERAAGCDQRDAATGPAMDDATDPCRAVRRAQRAADLTDAVRTAHPSVVEITPPEVEAAHAALIALGARAQLAVEACGLGLATPERLAVLDGVRAELDALRATFPPEDALRANLDHSRGYAALAYADAAAFLGRHAAALGAYAGAADAFTAAGEPARAADAEGRAATLRARLDADLDAEAARALGAVIDVGGDALDRAAALADLARQYCAAGDYFEAIRAADETTAVLRDAGVGDPDVVGLDQAAADLFGAAAARAEGSAFVQRCSAVATTWAGILQARMAARRIDAATAARADAMLPRVFDLAREMMTRMMTDATALDAALAPYGIGAMREAPDPEAAQASAWQQAVAALDARVQDAAEACDALAPGAPCDDLATAAAALEAAAADLPALQRARCRLLTARVRLQQGDVAACRAALDETIALLLADRATAADVRSSDANEPDATTPSTAAPDRATTDGLTGDAMPPAAISPAAFASAVERQVYLDAQWIDLKLAGAGGDFDRALAVCVRTVDFVEALRAHVGAPYQQSAFLASMTWAYDYGIGIARRRGAWDTMFALMDAAKARGALRRPPPPDSTTREGWRAIDADPDPVRRARRWSLATIARAQQAPAPPLPHLAAVQGALGADEGVLAYYWIDHTLLVVAAIDRTGLDVERVEVGEDDVARLHAYTTLLAAGQVNRNVGRFFDTFGELLIPAACRARLRDCRRLVVSPHRALHLFPFHAVAWDGAPLIERCAVRYAPNLGSLLVPWTGPGRDAPVLSIGCGTFPGPFVGTDAPPALDDAEPEAAEVAAAYRARGRAVTLRTGADASRAGLAALADLLPTYGTVHLATHARSVLAPDAADDPLATRVYLRDGTLDGVGVATLGLRADLVVLAACNSGQRAIAGRGLAELPGDDVLGLQGVLFGSGVRGVLGALWPVASEPARRIMRRLHEGLADGAPADLALQAAVRDHRAGPERWRHPIYWAPYYLVELGRPAPAPETHDA